MLNKESKCPTCGTECWACKQTRENNYSGHSIPLSVGFRDDVIVSDEAATAIQEILNKPNQ